MNYYDSTDKEKKMLPKHVPVETKMTESELLEEKTNLAISAVVQSMENAINFLVNQRDSQRLAALQSCTNKLYQQAEECLDSGARMENYDIQDN